MLLGGYQLARRPGSAAEQRARLRRRGRSRRSTPRSRPTAAPAHSTAIIITAKHGQSPLDSSQIKRIKDGPIIDAINAAWTARHPGSGNLIVAGTDDDLWQSYLSVKTQQAADFVKNYLWNHDAPAVTYSGNTITVPHSGLAKIYAGERGGALLRRAGVRSAPSRRVRVVPGRNHLHRRHEDRRARRLQSGRPRRADPGVRPRHRARRTSQHWVETTQVAPTILRLLGLDPDALKAVRIEGTQALPGIGQGHGDR